MHIYIYNKDDVGVCTKKQPIKCYHSLYSKASQSIMKRFLIIRVHSADSGMLCLLNI